MSDLSLLDPALAWSDFLRTRVHNRPGYADQVAADAAEAVTPARLEHWLQALREGLPHQGEFAALLIEDCSRVLRELRERVFACLMVRDIAGQASLQEVTVAMSALADLAVQQAYLSVATDMAETHGIPHDPSTGLPQEMLILGMGKLGGSELNVSSDIDLIMLYGEDGETQGRRPLSNHEFYGRLTRRMMRVLSEVDAHGYVFRTDLRLRPDGDGSPLAWSLQALEHYLVAQGREWERYAWLKARCIPVQAFPNSDLPDQINQLEALRKPFVFRKYFDFDAFAALRNLRKRIREDWNRKASAPGSSRDLNDNIKLGEGGIREIEFIVQLFQLVRGGRHPTLQTPNLLDALAAEREIGLLTDVNASLLADAYRLLRRLEHMLQYQDDQQTHLLPREPARLAGLAHAMAYADTPSFLAELQHIRSFVQRTFESVFRLTGIERDIPALLEVDQLSSDPEQALLDSIQRWIPGEVETLAPRVRALLQGSRIRALSETSRKRLATLLPVSVKAASETRNPAATLSRLFDLIEHIAQRSAYMALLAEYPETLARVARLFSASEWAAQYVIRHPILLDEIVDWSYLLAPLDFLALRQTLSEALDACVLEDGEPDVERQMDIMRDTQRQWVFQLLVQDLDGLLTVEKLGDHLSLTADILLEEAMLRVWRVLNPETPTPPRFAVIAYGKLGGKELGYASDLDLVFLYDDTDDSAERYTRLAQRLLSWLGTMTASGRLYEVDLRLRPDGQSGLTVVSVESFENYQLQHAWPWEHQAITRARFAVGDSTIGDRFEQIRQTILLMPRDALNLAEEVVNMRRKIAEAHPNRSDQFDIKHDPGGMVDVEFVTQYLVLLHARTHRILLENLGNITLLKHAAEAGLLPTDLAERAGDAYRMLRAEQHAQRLQDKETALVDPSTLQHEREAVLDLWRFVFNTPRP